MSLNCNGPDSLEAAAVPPQRVIDLPGQSPRYVDLKTAGTMMSLSEATTRRFVD